MWGCQFVVGTTQARPDNLREDSGPSGSGAHPVDAELLALPAPPRGQRLITLTIMAGAVVAALALALSLKKDIGYTLAKRQPTPLGHVSALEPAAVPLNAYVTLAGTPAIARAVRFSRPLRGRYRMFPLAGQHDVFVQVADQPNAVARGAFTGRIVRFADLGARYSPVWQHLAEELDQPVTENSLVLLADEAPSDYYWTWLIVLLCVAFVALDTFFIVRWFRPLPWTDPGPD